MATNEGTDADTRGPRGRSRSRSPVPTEARELGGSAPDVLMLLPQAPGCPSTPAPGPIPQPVQWMVGEFFGNKIWYRDCHPEFHEELEDRFLAGDLHSHFTWRGGSEPKTFCHDLVNMLQTNTATMELKVLRRVVVLKTSRLR